MDQEKNQLQKTSDSSIAKLTDKEITIAVEVYEVNQLTPFPLTSIQIEDWSRTINKLLPDLDVKKLEKIIDDYKMDVIEWDYHKGIQNILRELIDQPRQLVY